MMNILHRFLVTFFALTSTLVVGSVSITYAATTLDANQYVIFYHSDLLGSPAVVTDHNGNTLWHEHSDPYGRARARVTETRKVLDHDRVGSRKGYTGHLKDEGSNLVYMKARFYDPQIGRFYSNDPARFSTENPMMFNRYSYVSNNPYRYVDPDGKNLVTAFGGFLSESWEGITGRGDGEANYENLGSAAYDGYDGEGSGFWNSLADDALSFIPVAAIIGNTSRIAKGINRVYSGKNESTGLAKAEALRDAELNRLSNLSNTQRDRVATVVGAHDPATGKVAIGVKRSGCDSGKCAEDLAAEALDSSNPRTIEFTSVIRPRNQQVIPRCDRCVGTFGPE